MPAETDQGLISLASNDRKYAVRNYRSIFNVEADLFIDTGQYSKFRSQGRVGRLSRSKLTTDCRISQSITLARFIVKTFRLHDEEVQKLHAPFVAFGILDLVEVRKNVDLAR